MANFWIFFQLSLLILTDENNLLKVLNDIEKLLMNPFLLYSYYEKQEIVQNIKNLNKTNNEKYCNLIFYLYKHLENKSKYEIDILVEQTKNFYTKNSEFKEALLFLKTRSVESNTLNDENKKVINKNKLWLQTTLKLVANKLNSFVKFLDELEKTFIARRYFQQLSNEERLKYLKKIESFERKAEANLESIDATWESIINANLNYEKELCVKYTILLQASDCWHKFKQDLKLKNNKVHSLISFNYCFYSENFEFLLNTLGIHLKLRNPFPLLINHFKPTPVENEKGDVFQQLEALNTLQYFKVDRSIELEEDAFFSVLSFSFSLLTEDYNYFALWYSEVFRAKHKLFALSRSLEETEKNAYFTLIDTVAEQEQFLTKLRNRPDFLVVALERTRQLLDKVKETVSLRLGSVFVEEHELVSSFREGELASHPYLFSCKMFSLGDKLTDLFADVEELQIDFPTLEISNDAIKSAILRYEYYLTFPFLLFTDKDSLVTPEKGVNRYCRRVFAQNNKEGCALDFCSEETETFPLITWLGSDLLLENEKSKMKEIKNSLRKSIPKYLIVVLFVVFAIGLSLFVAFYKSLFFRFYYRRKVGRKKNRKSTK